MRIRVRVMGEVMRGAMDAPEGDAGEWDLEEPLKPTWEQIVAMQKESAALRAQAAAVLPALPTGVAVAAAAAAAGGGPTPRARRAQSRGEYPLFIPSYKDPPLLSGNLQQFASESLQGQTDDLFRGRLRHGSDFRQEIVPAGDKSQPLVSRHMHSLSTGLSPEMSGITPKSAMSGKSDGTNAPVTPASLSTSTFLQEEGMRKQSLVMKTAESSRGAATRQERDGASRGRGNHVDAVSPTDDSLWKGCSGGLSMVAPFAEGTSATGSGMDLSPLGGRMPEEQQSTEKTKSQQHGGLFGFLPWGKKTSSVPHSAPLRRQSAWERDSSKDSEKLIKSLQSQLDQSEKLRVREVGELQAMLKDMQEKFEQLHSHCRNLERQLSKQAKHAQRSGQEYHVDEDDSSSLESGSMRPSWPRSVPHPSLSPELFMSTYDAVVVSLRRLSRAICLHIREMGESASQVITAVLENHSIAKGRLRKAQKVLYFESFLNQIMFENFENVNFEPSGGAPVLAPVALQQLSFQAFQELQSVTWADIEQTLDEQGVIVNHSFHQFFVVRMEIVLHQLGEVGDTTTPGSLISAFFDAIKAVWLLHHLAFSFRPAATILRVSQGAKFEAEYMEQVQESDREARAKSVFLMINPGFLIDDWVVKCRVYCSRK